MASDKGEKRGKEGRNLLGPPSFNELENGRLKCVETGHEMLLKDRDSYSQSKRCRLGLIDFCLSRNKPPLNMFKQNPLFRSKLICKLTGDTVNKTEEHIWKHINGKRFLNKLEQMETEKLESNGATGEKEAKSSANCVNKQKKKKKEVEKIISEVSEFPRKESELEEADFWMPPVGERWDYDDGGDRWGSGSESGEESSEENETDGIVKDGMKESGELSVRTKRMSIKIGPSSFASKKKKSRKEKS